MSSNDLRDSTSNLKRPNRTCERRAAGTVIYMRWDRVIFVEIVGVTVRGLQAYGAIGGAISKIIR